MRSKHTFHNIGGIYAYLMITRVEIELGKHLCISKLVQEFFHSGNWEAVLHDEPPQSIFLTSMNSEEKGLELG